MIAAHSVPAAAPVWTSLELVENTSEGPAFDRCQIEATLETGRTTRWRVYYGEARAESNSGWLAIRSGSGCAQVGTEQAAMAWPLRPMFREPRFSLTGVSWGVRHPMDQSP